MSQPLETFRKLEHRLPRAGVGQLSGDFSRLIGAVGAARMAAWAAVASALGAVVQVVIAIVRHQ